MLRVFSIDKNRNGGERYEKGDTLADRSYIIMLVVPWLAVALVNGSNVIRVAVQNKVCIVQWKIDTRRLPL